MSSVIAKAFNQPPLVLAKDLDENALRFHRGEAGPQFYPMMPRQRRELINLGMEGARDFLRHRDPRLLDDYETFTIDAGRAIGFDPDVIVAGGSMIQAANGAMMRTDTSLSLPGNQLWQLAHLVPGLNYKGLVEVDDIAEIPAALLLRGLLKKISAPQEKPEFELMALMPSANEETFPEFEAVSPVPEFNEINHHPDPQGTYIHKAPKGPKDDSYMISKPTFRLCTVDMHEAMDKAQRKIRNVFARNSHKKTAHGQIPVLSFVPRFDGLIIMKHNHPNELRRLMTSPRFR